MKCIICYSDMKFYFTKIFNIYDLKEVHYWICPHCGFCASKTHFEMTDIEWTNLNNSFHNKSHNSEENPYNRNQRYFKQAQMLHLMTKHKLIDKNNWLDWGCGVGAVSLLLKKMFSIKLMTYDKYFTPKINLIDVRAMTARSFDLVVNTAVFEHVRDRDTLNEIESYVNASGCFAIHTLIPEAIPKNPEWMYLLPVHCAFHTNKSMQILMDSWGYNCSVYNEESKLWILFRKKSSVIKPKVEKINKSLGWNYLHFKDGFMDYWK
ncbi:methyltransferase domain-containing protein [Sulfurimonas sp.]|uniref:methyltransferase domain-containing protein n=1 Tax=Sulfurimonas sp. TaxID=2022749 RepID=UPI0026070352|nr:methyltransferase domain-containing protein [Sulfurimonas sp.]MDD5157881.1 methyltransferase domain-containing protein [Sulfurimonas sp.]